MKQTTKDIIGYLAVAVIWVAIFWLMATSCTPARLTSTPAVVQHVWTTQDTVTVLVRLDTGEKIARSKYYGEQGDTVKVWVRWDD
jgi:hypothetical protein